MHRLIAETPLGLLTDHINRDRLDNRRINLRIADKSVNARNTNLLPGNTSGYPGVIWDKNLKRWRATAKQNFHTMHLGQFKILEDAIAIRIAFDAWRDQEDIWC